MTKKEKNRIANIKWRNSHRERVREIIKKYRNNNLEKVKERNKLWVSKNKDRVREIKKEWYRKQANGYRKELRIEVIKIYGGKCVCCGENRFEFLAFDHINNDGAKHRKERGNMNIVEWLRKNHYPKNIQLLCHNCNLSKGFYGYCPHNK